MTGTDVRTPSDHPALVGVAVGSTVLTLPVMALAGQASLATVPGVLLAAVLVAFGRDAANALVSMGIVALLWAASAPPPLSPWSLVLALLLLTTHAAVALRSTAPPGAALDGVLLVRWFARCAVVSAITGAAFVVALALDHLHHGGSQVLVTGALVLLGGLVLLLRHETLRQGRA